MKKYQSILTGWDLSRHQEERRKETGHETPQKPGTVSSRESQARMGKHQSWEGSTSGPKDWPVPPLHQTLAVLPLHPVWSWEACLIDPVICSPFTSRLKICSGCESSRGAETPQLNLTSTTWNVFGDWLPHYGLDLHTLSVTVLSLVRKKARQRVLTELLSSPTKLSLARQRDTLMRDFQSILNLGNRTLSEQTTFP